MNCMHLFLLLAVYASAGISAESSGVGTPQVASVSPATNGAFPALSPAGGAEAKREEDGEKKDLKAATKRRDYVIVDCQPKDLEPIRQLLLETPEYPVKYSRASMRSFAEFPRFYDLCVVAKELQEQADPAEAETEAESDSEEDRRARKQQQLGRVVAVVGAAEVRRGVANILMVAVDKDFRRRGIAREALKAVLTKASKFARQEGRGSPLVDAVLHVWVPQLAPVQLYLGLGFVPTRYLRSYYSDQKISAGYEMHLPLPYEKATDRLAFEISLKEARLKELVRTWEELKSKDAPILTTAFVHVMADEQIAANLRNFLERTAPKGSDINAIYEEIMQPSSHFSFVALEPTGSVTGAIWVRSGVTDGVMGGTAVLVEEDVDGYKFLSLFEELLKEASRESGLRAVRLKMYCEDFRTLHLSWRLGFHPITFSKLPNRKWLGYSTYEYTLEAKLPWEPTEELAAHLKAGRLDREIVRLTDILSQPETPAREDDPEQLVSLAGPPPSSPPSAGGVQTPEQPAAASPSLAESLESSSQTSVFRKAMKEEELQKAEAAAGRRQAEVKDMRPGEEGLPWYRTVAGVSAMVFTFSLLMFFCFRSCARGREASSAGRDPPLPGGHQVTREGETDQRDLKETERRPAGRKEGYAQVGDASEAADADTASWWGQDEGDEYNFS
ncbi:hypothetical protein Efla_006750 [Eimeria flavescens]